LIKNCNLLIPRPPYRTSKLQEKSSSLKRKHLALQNLNFLNVCGSFWPSWIRIRIPNADPDPADPDPQHWSKEWYRYGKVDTHNPVVYLTERRMRTRWVRGRWWCRGSGGRAGTPVWPGSGSLPATTYHVYVAFWSILFWLSWIGIRIRIRIQEHRNWPKLRYINLVSCISKMLLWLRRYVFSGSVLGMRIQEHGNWPTWTYKPGILPFKNIFIPSKVDTFFRDPYWECGSASGSMEIDQNKHMNLVSCLLIILFISSFLRYVFWPITYFYVIFNFLWFKNLTRIQIQIWVHIERKAGSGSIYAKKPMRIHHTTSM
jgi:hypothetical protein